MSAIIIRLLLLYDCLLHEFYLELQDISTHPYPSAHDGACVCCLEKSTNLVHCLNVKYVTVILRAPLVC